MSVRQDIGLWPRPGFGEGQWDDAAYFKQQPGFISARLRGGIAGSPVFPELRGLGVCRSVQNSVRTSGLRRLILELCRLSTRPIRSQVSWEAESEMSA